MKKLFAFKRLSMKITFMIGATVIIVAGGIAGYMQTRIISEIDRHTKLSLQYQVREMAEESGLAFVDAFYRVESLKNLAVSRFEVEAYKNDPEGYIYGSLHENLSGFMYSMIDTSEYISAAYLSLDPDLTTSHYVGEIYYAHTDDGIVFMDDPLPYEDYQQSDPDMQWFFGAFNSGNPYWTQVYTDETGIIMVSYVEPVFVDGIKVGVVGADIPIDHIEDLIKNVRVYDTGFAILEDRYGEFFQTNEVIGRFGSDETANLVRAARDSNGEVFEIKLGGAEYMAAATLLPNDYTVYITAPKSEINAETTASLIRFSILFVSGFILVIIVAFILAKPIGKPLVALSVFLKRAASTGDLTLSDEDTAAISKYSQIKDETGQVVGDAAAFIKHVGEIAEALGVIASGDLTHDMKLQSDKDTMGLALHNLFENLNSIFSEIVMSTRQVAAGSKQLADGAQSLAQGSTLQSASVQQLSEAIAGIAQKTTENADMAGRAAEFADSIKQRAEVGSRQMDEMTSAVKEINQASQSIGKVIKVIDDIAFQTNILALNAAVEAARAGQHGKGFAVVAEEVRNLAAKSAEAAKDTGGLIANSIEKAELGARIADETAASLEEIVSGIGESSQIVAQIALTSEEQSAGISQVNTGIDQVAQVIQQNSATAQESAAASEQMSGQSAMLEDLITHFQLKDGRQQGAIGIADRSTGD